MDYKRIEKDNYVLHFINTNRFKTVNIELNFSDKLIEEEISYNKFLTRLLVYSNLKYNTRKKMATYLEDRYGSSLFASSSIIGSISNLLLGIEFINPRYTEEGEWIKNLDLLFDSLYKPNVINEEFDSKSFNLIKESLLTTFKIRNEYPSNIAYRNFEQIMFKGSIASFDQAGKKEIIETLTEKDLYKFYKKLFNNKCINVIIYGSIDSEHEELIINYVDKHLINIKGIKSNALSVEVERKLIRQEQEHIDKMNVLESHLIMGYNIVDLDVEKNKYALSLYNSILGGSANSLLFMDVREKNSFCYSVNSSYYKYSKALVVKAGINKKNYKDCVKVIKNCFKKMNDRKVIEENIGKVKKEMNTRLNSFYDSSSALSDYYFMNEFNKIDDVETQRDKYNNVTVDEILEINKHIEPSIIYFLEGDKINENA